MSVLTMQKFASEHCGELRVEMLVQDWTDRRSRRKRQEYQERGQILLATNVPVRFCLALYLLYLHDDADRPLAQVSAYHKAFARPADRERDTTFRQAQDISASDTRSGAANSSLSVLSCPASRFVVKVTTPLVFSHLIITKSMLTKFMLPLIFGAPNA
ncbi:hypothetical protein KCU66_g46, partial [Aureobasidium melanogenum]